jgi:hypothetical protein
LGGQAAERPLQLSATSQPPDAAARHSVPAAANPSAGHAADEPVHTSATSQPPGTATRHATPADAIVHRSVQQSSPSHASPGSTTPLPQSVIRMSSIPTHSSAREASVVMMRIWTSGRFAAAGGSTTITGVTSVASDGPVVASATNASGTFT